MSTSQWIRSKKQFSPRSEQVRGIKLILEKPGARLFLKPGKGKTVITLKAFKLLKDAGHIDKLLVLAPLRVIMTSWPDQLALWADLEGLTHSIIHDKRVTAMAKDADIYLMNYEGLLSAEFNPDKRHIHQFLDGKRWMLACDESTMLKNPASLRFKKLKRLLPKFSKRVILTGTPHPNKLEDLFSQCYVTDSGADLGQYITHFRQQYMRPAPSGFGYVPQHGAMERVAAKIAPTTLQLAYEEALPSEEIPVWVHFPLSAQRFYKELKDEFLAELGDTMIMAPSSGALFNKLRQVCQGAIYMPDGTCKHVHDAKLDALEGIINELQGEPVLIFTQFQFDVEMIRARFGADIPYIGSGTSAKDGRVACQLFQAGELPILLGHPSSIARGVDGLQHSCSTVVWYGLDQSYELTFQANLRVIRDGNKADQVTIYQILVDCATERAILRNVTQKEVAEDKFCALLREELANDLL